MNRFAGITASLTMAVLLFAGVASAQFDGQKINANIPFDFVVGNVTLPAGQYAFLRTGPNTLLVRNAEGRGLFTLVSDSEQRPDTGSDHSRLRFATIEGKHVLVELWNEYDGVGNVVYGAHALLEEARYPALHGISAGRR